MQRVYKKMIILGHKLIKFEPFYFIDTLSDVVKFDNLLFEFNENLVEKALNKSFSIIANNVTEVVLSNAFGAKFIIINDKSLVKEAANLAEHYLFDSKITLIIEDESELKEAINLRVDAVIFRKAIK